MRIGVDSGGTFTDIVVVNDRELLLCDKVASTPADPGSAVLNGILQAIQRLKIEPSDIFQIIHGTTVATNALLERKGARTALITTRGFRDVLAIQRQNRPELYNLRSRKPQPLVPRELRFEIHERTLADGTVAVPVDLSELKKLAAQLRELEIESIVVGLLHSNTNPENEIAVQQELSSQLSDVRLSTSHAISSEPGEYERFSTAVANGYVQPIMQQYLSKLAADLNVNGITASLSVMMSNGGIATTDQAAQRAIDTVLSGPAGGVQACVQLARQSDGKKLIAADMGGTSFDVALVTDAEPTAARESMLGGLPLRTSLLDIQTIGAGGGSIGWVDAGGALRVGPQSAGARPGPACYGLGGTQPTVTDANLVLGRLSEASKLAGSLTLSRQLAAEAVRQTIAEPLGITVRAAALGMLQIVNASMVAAIRKLTVEQGIDPRDYAICPYGGAGPLHAAELADELGIDEILLPTQPGVFSAAGLLQSPMQQERERYLVRLFEEVTAEELNQLFDPLTRQAIAAFRSACPDEKPQVIRAIRLRYRGQNQDISLAAGDSASLSSSKLNAAFHHQHQLRFGFSRPDQPLELASLMVGVRGDRPAVASFSNHSVRTTAQPSRPVVFADGEHLCAVVSRSELCGESPTPGPLILQQADTTVLVPPDWQVQSLPSGILRMRRKEHMAKGEVL